MKCPPALTHEMKNRKRERPHTKGGPLYYTLETSSSPFVHSALHLTEDSPPPPLPPLQLQQPQPQAPAAAAPTTVRLSLSPTPGSSSVKYDNGNTGGGELGNNNQVVVREETLRVPPPSQYEISFKDHKTPGIMAGLLSCFFNRFNLANKTKQSELENINGKFA